MTVTPERLKFHREVMEKYPSDEKCACDPAYGRWCAFHADFDSNMSLRTRELMAVLATEALTLHEAIRDYLAYPVKGNHMSVSRAIGGAQTMMELYLKERERDSEIEKDRLRRERE